MFILVDNNNNVCRFTGSSIEYGVFDESFNKWKVTNDNYNFYVIGENYTKFEVESIPEDCKEMKYCYTEEKGFYLNEKYTEPINAEDEIKRLILENIELKAQLDKVQEVLDYLVMQ
ncbi:hypothetical protein [Anaerosporobacter faecicola]|uniref:hypothetical protein n=1 Tax=Anaerosporobacter faecicola TaxID=2718714 RepID=UPI00143B3A4B|nr:hypothetical protein [Anaerosporobacter faecicola]